MPGRMGFRTALAQMRGDHRPEVVHPAAHGLVRDRDAALREQILNVTKAQREPEIELNRLMYHLGREPISGVTDFPHSLGYSAYLHPTSYCRRDKTLPPARRRRRGSLQRSAAGCLPAAQHRRSEVAQHLAQAMHLIEQIENDRDGFLVHAHVLLQVVYQSGPREIDVGKIGGVLFLARQQPTCFDPGGGGGRIEPRREKKFARAHDHASVDCRAPRVRAARSVRNRSSSGSGLSGSMTFKVTYSSPRAPPAPGA